MTIANKKFERLEILVSTMNRSSLTFLESMFPHESYLNYRLLIINQTTEDCLLSSEYDHIRVINSFDRGLPNSRNLALENAQGPYCLIADDDIKYERNFYTDILNGLDKYPSADMVTFQLINEKGELHRQYPEVIKHNKKSISTANSVVIVFNLKSLLEHEVGFNPNFGLGSTFPTANEYVFLRNALAKNLKLFFEPKVLLSHPNVSSGMNIGSDIMVYSRAALFYKYSGILGYLRLCKYLYLVHRRKVIRFSEIGSKFRKGLDGIKKYKQLVREGKEIR